MMMSDPKGWRRSRRTDLWLRLAGVLLLGVAALAIRMLLGRTSAATYPDALDYLLATVSFVGASAGAGLLALGRHIFDEVEVSERWRRRPAGTFEPRSSTLPPYTVFPFAREDEGDRGVHRGL